MSLSDLLVCMKLMLHFVWFHEMPRSTKKTHSIQRLGRRSTGRSTRPVRVSQRTSPPAERASVSNEPAPAGERQSLASCMVELNDLLRQEVATQLRQLRPAHSDPALSVPSSASAHLEVHPVEPSTSAGDMGTESAVSGRESGHAGDFPFRSQSLYLYDRVPLYDIRKKTWAGKFVEMGSQDNYQLSISSTNNLPTISIIPKKGVSNCQLRVGHPRLMYSCSF